VSDSLYGWRGYLQVPSRPCLWHGWIVATEGRLSVFETSETGLETGTVCRLVVAKRGHVEDYEATVLGVSGKHMVLQTSVCKVLPSAPQEGRRIDDQLAARVFLDGGPLPIEVVDLSPRGFGYLSAVALPEGQELEFEFFLPDRLVTAKGSIAHQRPAEGSGWRGGCRLAFASRLEHLAWNKHLESPLQKRPAKSERLGDRHPFKAPGDAA